MDDKKTKDEELGENLGNIFKEEYYEVETPESPSLKRLQKVKKNSLIAGVCTGIAEYFGMEPIIIRVIFIISIFFGGWGIAAYFMAAVLMPSESNLQSINIEDLPENNYAKTITGSIFIFIGLYFIVDSFGYSPSILFFGLSRVLILPIFLIITGVFLIVKINDLSPVKSGIRYIKLVRSKNDRRILGVCGGLASYLNIESNNLRMIWIIFSFISIGIGIIIYLFIAALTETEIDVQLEI